MMPLQGLCLIYYKLHLKDGDTEDVFQLCRFDPKENRIVVLDDRTLQSRLNFRD